MLDLGCHPGAWLQVASESLGPAKKGGRVIGVDLQVGGLGCADRRRHAACGSGQGRAGLWSCTARLVARCRGGSSSRCRALPPIPPCSTLNPPTGALAGDQAARQVLR